MFRISDHSFNKSNGAEDIQNLRRYFSLYIVRLVDNITSPQSP